MFEPEEGCARWSLKTLVALDQEQRLQCCVFLDFCNNGNDIDNVCHDIISMR